MIALFVRIHHYLNTWPDSYLTIALLLAAVIIACIALTGDGFLKSVALAYIVFP